MRFVVYIAVLTGVILPGLVPALQKPLRERLLERAQQGDAEAQYDLAKNLEAGRIGLKRDIESIKFRRLARMAETERVNRILSAMPDAQTPDVAALRQQIGEAPEQAEEAVKAVAESGMSDLDPAELKALSHAAQSALFGGVAAARSTVLHTLDQLPSAGASWSDGQRVLWQKLRERLRQDTESFQEFRRRSVGSLYH